MSLPGSHWLLLFVFLALDLIFIALRSCLLNTRQPQLIHLQEKMPQAVERTQRLLKKPYLRAMLRAIVVLIHFLLVGAGMLLFLDYSGAVSPQPILFLLALVAGTFIILVLEFATEGLILYNVEGWALRLTLLGELLYFIFRPLSWLLMSLLGSPELLRQIQEPVIEDELRNWAKEGDADGKLEQDERKMIYSIFQLSETLCREIMVPRIDIMALDVDTPLTEAVQKVNASGHSRVPVYEVSVDNLIGLLHVKDLLRIQASGEMNTSMRQILRTLYFVPEAKNVADLLREMQSKEVQMTVVVDEYGGVAGLVTLEDIVEEIVGEIRDEYDHGEELPYLKINNAEYIFQGGVDVDDVNDLLGIHLTREISDTLGGFVYGKIGYVPLEGEQVEVENWLLKVQLVKGRRILKVRAIQHQTKPELPQKQANEAGAEVEDEIE